MPQLDVLRDFVVIFVAALVVVSVLGRPRVPFIAGLIVAGALVDPGGLAPYEA